MKVVKEFSQNTHFKQRFEFEKQKNRESERKKK